MGARRFQFQISGLLSFVLFAGSIGAMIARWHSWGLVLELPGHRDQVHDLHFSSDGNMLVSASWDQTAKIWDANTGKLLQVLTCHNTFVDSASFSRDDKRVLTSSSDGSVRVWDVITGQEVRAIIDFKQVGHPLNSVFSPDDLRILTSDSDRNCSFVSDSATGQEVLSFKGDKSAFAPNGKLIATCWNDYEGHPRAGTIFLWEATLGREIKSVTGHSSPIRCVEFSVDSTCIVTGSNDTTARVWNAQTLQELATIRRSEWVRAASFSSDGSRIITSSVTALISDSHTGEPLYEFIEDNSARFATVAVFSPDCTHVATAYVDGAIHIWVRRYPEWWWGHFYRPEVWAFVAFGSMWLWRLYKWIQKRNGFTYGRAQN